MAKAKPGETAATIPYRKLSTPRRSLLNMVLFCILIGMLVALVAPQLQAAFFTNPFLNGFILVVLILGIMYVFGQVLRLYPEVRWVNAFRIADPGLASGAQPRLLAPMATMLRDRTGALSLSATSMRSIMDSIGARLDEARDTGRYLVSLLVFLGLLGTFWGLLDTIGQVGRTISTLDTRAAESTVMFEELKQGLAAPLRGMGTAFSASLLGLSGSLILGFLQLQANHAQSRFYNDLEEWLSGITELTPAGATGEQLNRQMLAAIYDLQGVLSAMARQTGGEGGALPGVREDNLRNLATGVDQLVRQMRSEQKIVREWIDEQSAQQAEVVLLLKEVAQNLKANSR